MISRSLLIIAPVALITACATGQPELEPTSSSSQGLCTVNCDSTATSSTLKDWSLTTTFTKGDSADIGQKDSPDEMGKDEPFYCNCKNVDKDGNPKPLQLVWDGASWVCRNVDEKCCVMPPTSDPGFTPSSTGGDEATYKKTNTGPTGSWPPPPETISDDDGTCGPSSYASAYNPCTYAWNGPYYRCNWNGYCFCSPY